MALRVSRKFAEQKGWITTTSKEESPAILANSRSGRGRSQPIHFCPLEGVDPQSRLWRALLSRMPDAAKARELVWELKGIVPGRRFAVDIAWMTNCLAIEVDGYMHHGFSKRGFHRDREKDRLLQLQGWTPVRFSAKEISSDLDGVVNQILRLNAAIQHGP